MNIWRRSSDDRGSGDVKPVGGIATLWRYRVYLRPVRGMMAAGLGASGVTALALWAAPWPLKFIFDSVINHLPLPSWLRWLPSAPTPRLTVLVGALLGIAALEASADYLANRLVATAGQSAVYGLRCHLFSHLEAQSLRFHQGRRTGDLMARLGGDMQALQSATITAAPTLIRNSLTLVGMVTIMLVIDWRYTLLALGLVPVLYLATRHYLRRITSLQRQGRRADGEASAVAQEVLTSISVVQAFGTERAESRRYARATRRGLEQNRRAIIAQSEFTRLMTMAMTASTAAVIFFGAQAVLQHQLTIGLLLVFMAYLRGMYSPVRQLAKLAGVVGRAKAASERVTEILETAEEVPEWRGARRLSSARGEIHLLSVHFAYPGRPSVLKGVDLVVPAGSHQALVGVTGSGKSTLVRLIPRFLDPISGSVRLDGVDLRDLTLASLRRQVAMVPQEPVVFHGTVAENILYGHPSGDRALAIGAARAAGVDGVIEALSDGYDTLVGERGSTLSGASGNAWRSRVRWPATHRSCSSTNPAWAWMPNWRAFSWTRWQGWPREAPQSQSLISCGAFVGPTRSRYLWMAGSRRRAPTTPLTGQAPLTPGSCAFRRRARSRTRPPRRWQGPVVGTKGTLTLGP